MAQINTLPGRNFQANQQRLAQRQAQGGTGQRFMANHPRFAARQAAQPAPMPQPQMPMSRPQPMPRPTAPQQPMQQPMGNYMKPSDPGGTRSDGFSMFRQPTQEMYQQAGQQALQSFGTNQPDQGFNQGLQREQALNSMSSYSPKGMTYGGQPLQKAQPQYPQFGQAQPQQQSIDASGYTQAEQEQMNQQMMQQRMGTPRSY